MNAKTITVSEAYRLLVADEPSSGVLWLNGRNVVEIQPIETDYYLLHFADGRDDAVEGETELEQDL